MKLKSLIMFSAAALAFAACSNDEEVKTTKSEVGNYALNIRIVDPSMSRSITDPSSADEGTGNIIKVEGELTVEIKVGGTWVNHSTASVIEPGESINGGTQPAGQYTFYNLSTPPEAVRAYINNGDKLLKEEKEEETDDTYDPDLSITATTPAMQAAPKDIPAFGSAEVSDTPQGTVTIEGEVYENYTATVNMAIPVGRLEVGNIKHIDSGECPFTDLTLTGVYMDHIKATYGAENTTNYVFPDGGDKQPVLLDNKSPLPISITSGTAFPADNKVFAFNFFEHPEGGLDDEGVAEDNKISYTNPVFKLCFTQKNSNQAPVRYAIIKDYQNTSGQSIRLEAGHIYRITDVELTDDNLGPREEPNDNYIAVTVTVVEAKWTIENIKATWH